MSRPSFNRGQSNVTDWLDGHYEYVLPDESDKGTKSYPYTRPDPFQATTPAPSEESSSRTKNHDLKEHRSTRRHDRPFTPPSEDETDRARDREQYRSARRFRPASGTRNDDTDRRATREHREPRYPPRTDRGRPPRRPPMKTASTTPDFRQDTEDTRRHRHHRRYSNSSSPPRGRGVREDTSSRDYHRYRSGDDHARSTRGERDPRDKADVCAHYSGTGKGSATHVLSTKARGSKEPVSPAAAAAAAATAGAPKTRRSSFAFLSDPRFATAAQAALSAGVSAAVGAMGQPNAGVKVAQAALGAAAMGALRHPGPEKEREREKSGGLGRKDSTRRKR